MRKNLAIAATPAKDQSKARTSCDRKPVDATHVFPIILTEVT
jgi:hypothetical protein